MHNCTHLGDIIIFFADLIAFVKKIDKKYMKQILGRLKLWTEFRNAFITLK